MECVVDWGESRFTRADRTFAAPPAPTLPQARRIVSRASFLSGRLSVVGARLGHHLTKPSPLQHSNVV